MIPLRKTCRQIAAMLIAREDRNPGLVDSLALRLHMLACNTCPKFERQVLSMRNSMKQWRNYTGPD